MTVGRPVVGAVPTRISVLVALILVVAVTVAGCGDDNHKSGVAPTSTPSIGAPPSTPTIGEATPTATVLLGGCPDYVPTNCAPLPNPPPTPSASGVKIDKCYVIRDGGTYTFNGYVNILENRQNRTKGAIYVVDTGKVVELRFPSMLIEKGGTLQAGSLCN